MSKIIKASTKKGQQLINSASYVEGFFLKDVYDSYSSSKQAGWNYCYGKYINTPERDNFHICSHNTFQFSVAWKGVWGGERAMFLETASNSYIILLDK